MLTPATSGADVIILPLAPSAPARPIKALSQAYNNQNNNDGDGDDDDEGM